MIFNLTVTTPPATEPVSLAEAKAHMRITHDADDDAIESLIRAARAMCEGYTGRALVSRGVSLYMDAWVQDIVALPLPPLQSVGAIHVYDAAGVAATFPATSYAVDAKSHPARILLSGAPPQPGQSLSGIEIAYTAGYGDAADVPQPLKEGILRLVAHLYLNRGDNTETAIARAGAQHLFQSYRIMVLA